MSILEMQVETLMRLCTACDQQSRDAARAELLGMLKKKNREAGADPEDLVREILLELGAPEHLLGHPYAVQAVLLVVHDRMYINNITFGLYPQLAARFDTTAARVERAIRHLIEVTWSRGDVDVLSRYFGNTVSPEKGKPTNGEFIARLANIVSWKMKEAA